MKTSEGGMRMIWVVLAMVAVCFAPNQAAPESESPTPHGCTNEGKLSHGLCSKGRPVYLPDGEAIDYLKTTNVLPPEWPEGTNKKIKANLNLQFVVLPDGTVTEIQPTYLRVTLPGEEEQRMNATEDTYGFVAAASVAVAGWKYASPRLEGEPVAVYGSACVDFSAQSTGNGGDEREHPTGQPKQEN